MQAVNNLMVQGKMKERRHSLYLHSGQPQGIAPTNALSM